MLWNAHKAYMRGICIQMGARFKRQRQRRITELTNQIFDLETLNKQKASLALSRQITNLRYDLRFLLLEKKKKTTKKLKMNCYVTENKAGKLLAQTLKGHRYKLNHFCPILLLNDRAPFL